MYVQLNGTWQYAISVWLWPWPENKKADKPCGLIPEAGIKPFWEALGVQGIYDGYQEELQKQWIQGNMVLAAPTFPVLSELIQMQIDNAEVKAEDISALLREVEIGRANCDDPLGIAVFDALKTCGMHASAHSTGILLSPF